jgi:hypothetical protein
LTALLAIRYTYHVKIKYSDDGIGRDYQTGRAEGESARNSQAKGPIPDEASESRFIPAPTRQFRNSKRNSIAEESFRFKYGARDFVRASCFFVLVLEKCRRDGKPDYFFVLVLEKCRRDGKPDYFFVLVLEKCQRDGKPDYFFVLVLEKCRRDGKPVCFFCFGY